jgi:hypothetical protein
VKRKSQWGMGLSPVLALVFVSKRILCKRPAKHHLVHIGGGVNLVGECHDISSTYS